MRLDHDMSRIDVVTTMAILFQLLAFVSPESLQSDYLNVELIDDTMFMSRIMRPREDKHVEYPGDKVFQSSAMSYTLERDFTEYSHELAASRAHNWIIKYKLGGLNFMTQHQVDARSGAKRTKGNEYSSTGVKFSPCSKTVLPIVASTFSPLEVIECGSCRD